MLFRKDIEPRCEYCLHARRVSDSEMVCKKRGITSVYNKCRTFSYDALKRNPPKPAALVTRGLKDEDFVL